MSLSSLEYSNHLIRENRRRIDRIRAELAAASSSDTSLRQRVLQQMELSLKCLERHRDALASRGGNSGLNGHSA